jgi:hypothetical protein
VLLRPGPRAAGGNGGTAEPQAAVHAVYSRVLDPFPWCTTVHYSTLQ